MPHLGQPPDYTFFITNDHLLLLQRAADVSIGRFIKAVDKNGREQYTINLDLAKFGLSRDGLLGMSASRALLTVFDYKKILLFRISSGIFLGHLPIWPNFETSFGKVNQLHASALATTELNYGVFLEGKMLLIHDPRRRFPSVIDIYKFW